LAKGAKKDQGVICYSGPVTDSWLVFGTLIVFLSLVPTTTDLPGPLVRQPPPPPVGRARAEKNATFLLIPVDEQKEEQDRDILSGHRVATVQNDDV
jgi:hypothetical protein